MDFTSIARKSFIPRARRTDRWATDSVDIQIRQLKNLLETGADSEIGKKYGFKELSRLPDPRPEYGKRIPLQFYEDIRHDVMRMILGEKNVLWPGVCRNYAQSSGTNGGKSKYIPITDRALAACHYKGAADAVAHYLRHHPESRIFAGKAFALGGSFANELHLTDPRVRIGDVSATLISKMNPIVNLFRIPGKRIALMPSWDEKLPALVEVAKNADITNISGVPSWFLAVIKEILKQRGTENLHDVWPNLEVFFHGGISFAPYREIYESFTDPAKMHFVETYNASEGFFAVQDLPDEAGMLLTIDNDVYYEFLALGGNTADIVDIENLKPGHVYEMIISSSNGLWRYRLGDTVRIESVNPVRITIAGRTKTFINAFGEELMEENAEKAIADVCAALDCSITDYTAAPLFADNKRRGRHQWFIEWNTRPQDITKFAKMLDSELRKLNSDYDAKRSGKYFLDPPEIISVPTGTFAKWLKSIGNHKLGGQRKVPRLSNDRTIADSISHK